MPSNNHPPVPPGCEYFLLPEEEGADVTFRVNGDDYAIFMELSKPEWRPVIAAVAEVAWTRIAQRSAQRTAFNEALRNANAWRAWGERKEDDNADR